MEASGTVLAATFLASFPHADTPYTGVSSIVVGDAKRGGAATAKEVCDRMLAIASKRRAEYAFFAPPLAESVARAKQLGTTAPTGPVLLIDHCDNCGSGGAQDVMMVVAEILRQELDDVAIAPIRDAARGNDRRGCRQRREPATRWQDGHAVDRARGAPLQVRGRVRTITDGEFVITGPMYTGIRTFLGRTAVRIPVARRS
jgi:microcystin degradation protein MlrC